MSDEENRSPCRRQRIFGAGVTKRTIHFLPAVTAHPHATQVASRSTPPISPGDRYLNIVLKNNASAEDNDSASIEVQRSITPQRLDLQGACCGVCNLPRNAGGEATSVAPTNHESTIAHMVCLTHTHPPSHLDRNRQGLKYLSFYGWDPDSRQGLGATGEGIRAPIKAKVKNDTVGLGVKIKKNKRPSDAKVERMDAKQVRKMDIEDRRKQERLQEMFYSHDDLERYLAGG